MSNFLLIVLDFVHDYKNLPRLKIFGRGYNVSVLLKKYVAVLDPGNNDLVDLRDQTPKLRRCEALNETGLHEILNETGANKEDERNDIAETVQATEFRGNQEDCQLMWSFYVQFLDRIFLGVHILLKIVTLLVLLLEAIL